MGIQLGPDEHPILDQFSGEGFVDLVFEILDLVEIGGVLRFSLAASHAGQTVGMGVEIHGAIKAGLDHEMNLIKSHVYHEGVRFFSAGAQSNRLVQAISELYATSVRPSQMIPIETYTAIALHQGEINLMDQPIKLKIFGRDSEPFNEDDYYESFFNVDIPNRLAFWNEKDSDYRDALLKGLSAP